MFLTESIVNTQGEQFQMVGAIPGHVQMQTTMAALGYREIVGTEGNFLIGADELAKGHEYHYSTYEGTLVQPAYHTKGLFGAKLEGYKSGRLVAGYTHFHFVSNPQLVDNWLDECRKVKREGGKV